MSNLSAEQLSAAHEETPKAGIGAFIALFLAICFFSGVFYKSQYAWLGAFDYSTLAGKFGMIDGTTFVGKGGIGARQGFMFGFGLVPGVMLALGLIQVLEHYGALRAAQRLMTPLLKPILGVPGTTGLALITDLQSTDAGAALTKSLYDNGGVTKKQLIVMSAWQYAGAGLIANYFSTVVAALAVHFLVPVWQPLVVMLVLKFVGGAFIRLVLSTVYKKDFENE